MFYCEECRVKNRWPKAFSFSYGPCELCRENRDCHDRPSSSLPSTLSTQWEKEEVYTPQKKGGMNREEAVKKLLALKDIHDNELAHFEADAILLLFLRENGCADVASAFDELRETVSFWYA